MTPAPEESPEASEEPPPDTSPEPTPAPTPEPTPTPAPTAAPAETEAPQNGHEHRFSQLWTADETSHWHECDCGERSEGAPHEFKWKTLEVQNGVATQEGVCRVCAYRETKQVTVNDAHIINKIPMTYVFIGALGLMAVMIAAESVKRSRRR